MRKAIAKALALGATFAVATGLVVLAQSTFDIGSVATTKAAPEAAATVPLPPLPVEIPPVAVAPEAAAAPAATAAAATLGNVDVSVVRKPKNAKSRDKARGEKRGRPTQSASR